MREKRLGRQAVRFICERLGGGKRHRHHLLEGEAGGSRSNRPLSLRYCLVRLGGLGGHWWSWGIKCGPVKSDKDMWKELTNHKGVGLSTRPTRPRDSPPRINKCGAGQTD
jgi:hypothetical protein